MKIRLIATLVVACATVPAWAAGDAAAGKAHYAACAACHGPDAAGIPAMNAPALAGQDAAYLERQLLNFRAGIRGAQAADAPGAQMRGMAATLPDAQAVQDVAAYLASLAPPAPVGEVAGDLHTGNNFYQGKCGACHGLTAGGNPALNAPRLAGQDAAYLRRQFMAFREGTRGAHPSDRYGRQMAMMAMTLDPGKELDDVLAFVHAQTGETVKH